LIIKKVDESGLLCLLVATNRVSNEEYTVIDLSRVGVDFFGIGS
jgi:hypothetical protein